jgi:hypothetical protein
MSQRFAESASLIGIMVLSIKWNLHRYPQCQFASSSSGPRVSQGCIVGPPARVKKALYMSQSLAESALLIGLMLLSIE